LSGQAESLKRLGARIGGKREENRWQNHQGKTRRHHAGLGMIASLKNFGDKKRSPAGAGRHQGCERGAGPSPRRRKTGNRAEGARAYKRLGGSNGGQKNIHKRESDGRSRLRREIYRGSGQATGARVPSGEPHGANTRGRIVAERHEDCAGRDAGMRRRVAASGLAGIARGKSGGTSYPRA